MLVTVDLSMATRPGAQTGIERYSISTARLLVASGCVALTSSAGIPLDFNATRRGFHPFMTWLFLPFLISRSTTDVLLPAFPPSPLFVFFPRLKLHRVVHDTIPFSHPATLSLKGRLLFRHLERAFLSRYTTVFCPTPIVQSEFAEIFPDVETQCSGNAPGNDFGDYATRPDTPALLEDGYILAVGTVEPRKGYESLLALVASETIGDLPLVIVGRPGWGRSAERLETSIQSRKNIVWLKGCQDAELRWLYAHASAFVSTSIAEGFNMPLVEAGCAALPIVCSDLPIHRWVAPPWANFIPLDASPADFKQALAAATRIPIDAREYRKRHTWNSVAELILKAFEK